MNEETKKILKMVEDGTITAEEAEKLISAMASSESVIQRKNHFLRVKVTEGGNSKVNVNLPISLVKIAAKIGIKFIPDDIPAGENIKDINWNEVIEAIREGASGKIVDVQDGDDTVEIYVE